FSLSSSPFVASRSQFVSVGALILVAIAAAFSVEPRRHAATSHNAPRPVWVFLMSLALSIAFMMVESVARDRGLRPFVSVIVRLGCEAIAAGLILSWSGRRTWGPRHYLAIAAGTTLTYALFGLVAFLHGRTNLGVPTNAIDIAGQVALALGVFLLIWWGARR